MNVLLTGATGFIGRNIAQALTAAGHRVTPVSRRHGIDFAVMDKTEPWLPHLRGIDAVINCVGMMGSLYKLHPKRTEGIATRSRR